MASGRFTAAEAQKPDIPADGGVRARGYTLHAKGTWGGGTITVTVTPDGATPVGLSPAVTISADGYVVLPNIGGKFVLTLAGGAGPYDVSWWLI